MILKKVSKATTSSTTGLETPVNYHHQQRNHHQYLNACSLAETTNNVGVETADCCVSNSSLVQHVSATGYPSSTPTNPSVIFGQSNVLFGASQSPAALYGDAASSSYCNLAQNNNGNVGGGLGIFDPTSQSCPQSLTALNCYVAAAQADVGSTGGYLNSGGGGNGSAATNCGATGGAFQWNQYSEYIPFATAPYEPFNPSFGHDAHQVVSQMVPSSATYKWMQIKRSSAKVGTVNICLTVI